MNLLMEHGKIAITTITLVEFVKLMEVFEEEGLTWSSGELPTANLQNWDEYKEQTCVDYRSFFGFADVAWFNNAGYSIMTFENFMRQRKGDQLLWGEYNKPIETEVEI